MPPMLGDGANSALHTGSLTSALVEGPDIVTAIARYEETMRARTYPLLVS
ncbi:hypothetical protein [Amycolatopsis sulphurea]|nr:hypothetical protein [Amycolatopsis sulphurea]